VRTVQEQRPDWFDSDRPASSEDDSPQLSALHELLRRGGVPRPSGSARPRPHAPLSRGASGEQRRVVEDKTLYEAVGIDRKTAVAYDQLLKNLLVLEALPGWESNRLSRLPRLAKRYLVDPAVTQIRPELALATSRPRLYHLREKNGRHETDLVIECGGGRVAGIEISPNPLAQGVSAIEQ
jgi:hypothetical protein